VRAGFPTDFKKGTIFLVRQTPLFQQKSQKLISAWFYSQGQELCHFTPTWSKQYISIYFYIISISYISWKRNALGEKWSRMENM
jgi:hypothetical protein